MMANRRLRREKHLNATFILALGPFLVLLSTLSVSYAVETGRNDHEHQVVSFFTGRFLILRFIRVLRSQQTFVSWHSLATDGEKRPYLEIRNIYIYIYIYIYICVCVCVCVYCIVYIYCTYSIVARTTWVSVLQKYKRRRVSQAREAEREAERHL